MYHDFTHSSYQIEVISTFGDYCNVLCMRILLQKQKVSLQHQSVFKCVGSTYKATSHIFVRICGDDHNSSAYIVDNNCCMNSGYRPSLTHRLTSAILSPPTPLCFHFIDTMLCHLGAVHESFEGHPDFELPTTGYVLDLNKSPPQPEKFQLYIETLRSDLKKPRSALLNIYKIISTSSCIVYSPSLYYLPYLLSFSSSLLTFTGVPPLLKWIAGR